MPIASRSLRSLLRAFLLLLLCSILVPRAEANDRAALRVLVQDFYKGYAKAADPQNYVLKSAVVTRGFKTAYTAHMKKGPGSDPIVEGQDVPSSGYVAEEVLLDGEKATVTLVPKDQGFETLKVHAVVSGGKWLIDGVNKLKGK